MLPTPYTPAHLSTRGLYIGKYPPPLMGKKYHENNARAPTKKEKKKERTREKKR